ncbi:MAG TPA: hypothetical protein VJ506_12095 [Candidatus Limnocylindrales bacterium]|nr:hypothetical protein [Candidatus Limnocylindrales bacterium]
MSMTGLIVAAVGVLLVAIGLARARAPWARYRVLKAQEENIARYEAWRGGLRDSGPTGASVAIEMLRNQLLVNGAIAGVGVVAIVVGLFLP